MSDGLRADPQEGTLSDDCLFWLECLSEEGSCVSFAREILAAFASGAVPVGDKEGEEGSGVSRG